MRTVIVCIGLPASGKTTWATDYVKKNNGKVKRINKDDLRAMLDCSSGDLSTEKIVISTRDYLIERLLSKGYDVVIDDTNFRGAHFLAICDAAKRVGDVRVFHKYFDITLKEALIRNRKRPHPVPDSVIENMFETHIKHKHLELQDHYFPPKQYPHFFKCRFLEPFGAAPAIIVDIDGTLALNLSNRIYYDLTRIGEDTLNPTVANLIAVYKEKGHAILIVSGRSDLYKNETETWLKDNGVPYDRLYMRREGDARGDTVIKRELFEQHIQGKYNISFVVDDRKKVCRMWREDCGLPVFQLNDVDF